MTEQSPNGQSRLPYDADGVITALAQQVGFLTAQLAVRDSVIEGLRGELAKAQAPVVEAPT